ncbi:MAG: ArsC family transcriptional regulator [Spirochaetaceae bacterium]|nr:ArsC family transcriptional regulator [Spirochaetaceae bacterium]
MAIQIFGTTKNFDTKKAERWFAERRIPVQVVNLKEKGISGGELENVISCLAKNCGSRMDAVESLIDERSKDYASIAYLEDGAKAEKLLENPLHLKQPIVRNGKNAATVGYCPKIWEGWQ